MKQSSESGTNDRAERPYVMPGTGLEADIAKLSEMFSYDEARDHADPAMPERGRQSVAGRAWQAEGIQWRLKAGFMSRRKIMHLLQLFLLTQLRRGRSFAAMSTTLSQLELLETPTCATGSGSNRMELDEMARTVAPELLTFLRAVMALPAAATVAIPEFNAIRWEGLRLTGIAEPGALEMLVFLIAVVSLPYDATMFIVEFDPIRSEGMRILTRIQMAADRETSRAVARVEAQWLNRIEVAA